MRTIQISEEVWKSIAARGIFDESANDVLERVFGIKPKEAKPSTPINRTGPRKRLADKTMSAKVADKILHVSFEDGSAKKWPLPDPSDKVEIRKVRDDAVNFAKENGATNGQELAVKKALTDAGYWLTK